MKQRSFNCLQPTMPDATKAVELQNFAANGNGADIETGSPPINNGRSSETLQSANEQPYNEETSLLKNSGEGENPFTLYSAESERSKSDDCTISSERRLDMENATTNWQTIMHVLKGNIGTGLLGLPNAMMHAGIVVGPVVLLVLAMIAVHCMHMLVQCSHALCKKTGESAMGYGQVAEEAVRQYSPRKAHLGRYFVNIFLCITQLGFCCVYFLFIADNIQQVATVAHLDVKIWILILLPAVILFSFIHNLNHLAPLSAIANVCVLFGVIATFVYLGKHLQDPHNLPVFAGWSTLPLFFGTAVFAFEGIGVVLPLENKMANPQDFGWVLNVAMGLVTSLYLLLGTMGYLVCGPSSCAGSITLNLPQTQLYAAVKMLFAISIFFSYFIQFYVPMEILQPPILSKIPDQLKSAVDYTIRILVVTFTCALAIGIPQLDNFISLVGAFSSSALAIIFPPLLHILTFSYDSSLTLPELFKDLAIALFGILGFAAGSYSSVLQIVQGFQQRHMYHIGSALNSTNVTLVTLEPIASLAKSILLNRP